MDGAVGPITTSAPGAVKRRILFVDDEQSVLDGLRNVLRGQRGEWQMSFVVSGAAALAELDQTAFDVVVSDVRMPNMDGATFLAKVKEKHPRTVRIVLSGQTDLQTAMRTVFVAHRFLSKPCDAAILRAAIERACKLQAVLQDEALREAAGDVGLLPSSPGLYAAITQALGNPAASMADVARVAERDPGLCAKILQVANSAFFGIGRPVSTVSEAASYLGAATLRNLALAMEAFPQLEGAGRVDKVLLRELRSHSLAVALLARQIMITRNRKLADDTFVAGMLHDVGHVILGMRGAASGVAAGVDHGSLGAYLLSIWGLPHVLTEAVAHHEAPEAIEHATFEVPDAIHLADRLVRKVQPAPFEPSVSDEPEIDLVRFKRLGVSSDDLATWAGLVREQIDAALAL